MLALRSVLREKVSWGWFIAVVLVLPLLVWVALGSYRAIGEELTQIALSRRSAVAYLVATTLAEKFNRLGDIGTALATRVRFRELVAAGRWTEAIEILKAVPQDFPFIDRIQLLDPRAVLKADIPASNARGRSFAGLDWYRGVSAGWQPYISEAYQRPIPPRANVFAIATPIAGGDARPVGVLLLQVRLDRFFDWVERIESPRGETVLIADNRGKLAFHSRIASQAELADFREAPGVQGALAGRVGVLVTENTEGKEQVVAAYAPVGAYGWAVVAQQPAQLTFEQRDLLLGLLRVAYALAALLCITAVVLAARIAGERRRVGEEALVKAQLEERVAERTAQLQAANRELEAFSYSIAHDLRAPLRAVDGFSRILLDEHAAALPAEAQRLLGVVRGNAQQMGRLIDDLLAFSQLTRQPLRRSAVDMTALVRRCLEELEAERAGRSLAITVAELPQAQADPAMLKQVWLNLIANAVKYTRKKAGASIHIGFQDDALAYYVRDNGVGFDMAYADKLFGVFQRLHRAEEYEGTGVGLAFAARVVERHGGRIWPQAAPGLGATFYFTLGARDDGTNRGALADRGQSERPGADAPRPAQAPARQ